MPRGWRRQADRQGMRIAGGRWRGIGKTELVPWPKRRGRPSEAMACLRPGQRRSTVQPTPINITAFYGVWSAVVDQCRSFKARTEGPYFTIRDRRYVPQGGGTCRKLSFQLQGRTLTVRGECLAEEAGFARINDSYSLVGPVLRSSTGETFQRCAP